MTVLTKLREETGLEWEQASKKRAWSCQKLNSLRYVNLFPRGDGDYLLLGGSKTKYGPNICFGGTLAQCIEAINERERA